jgi:hypothetical protein
MIHDIDHYSNQNGHEDDIPPKWEYKTIERGNKMDDRNLNRYGQEGWELVDVNSEYINRGTRHRYIFKRILMFTLPFGIGILAWILI